MPSVRMIRVKGHEYYQIVTSVRGADGRPKTKVLKHIGDLDALKRYALKGYLATEAERDRQDDLESPSSCGEKPGDPGTDG